MFIAFILQAASVITPTVTLAEAKAMSPTALANRLLPDRNPRPIVDAVVNGRGGLTPPSLSVNRVWITEQMVPFDSATCRSHVYAIEMGGSDPKQNVYGTALPTHPIKVDQYDYLWLPGAKVTKATCASAPARASTFAAQGFDLAQAAHFAEQARKAFAKAPNSKNVVINCIALHKSCGTSARMTLKALDWKSLSNIEQVDDQGHEYYSDRPKPVNAAWGPAHLRFTFPYAANGDTWLITVDRTPNITSIRMDAHTIIYE